MQDRKPDHVKQPVSPVPAVGVVCWRGDEVLLIRRGQAPRKGDWSIPGGRVQSGEPLKVAALRELHEETGIVAELVNLVEVYEIIEPGFHYVLVDYAASWLSGAPVAADDADLAVFIAFEDALHLLVHEDLRDVVTRSRPAR